MIEESEDMPRRRRSLFSSLVRFFGLLIIVVGSILLGIGAGYYLALIVALSGGSGLSTEMYRDGDGEKKIAIIPIEGVISDSTAAFTRKTVQAILDRNEDQQRFGAVVLRVNSPGGGVTASDQISHQLKRLRDEGDLPSSPATARPRPAAATTSPATPTASTPSPPASPARSASSPPSSPSRACSTSSASPPRSSSRPAPPRRAPPTTSSAPGPRRTARKSAKPSTTCSSSSSTASPPAAAT